jgi:hypothetical protein
MAVVQDPFSPISDATFYTRPFYDAFVSKLTHIHLEAENTGIPWLVRFQLVQSQVQCGLQIALNKAISRFSAVFQIL